MKVVTSSQMQLLDRRTIEEARIPGVTLMSRAGAAVAEAAERSYGAVRSKRIAVVCGKGNNGGDGFVVARLLKQRGAKVHTFLLAKPHELRGDALTMCRRWMRVAGRKGIDACPRREQLTSVLNSVDLIVDALLGTGLSSPVLGPYAEAIEAINESRAVRHVPVVAVDLPSGLHGDTGEVLGTAVRASLTVTFALPKRGLFLAVGPDYAGRIEVADIGIPHDFVDALETPVTLITKELISHLLPPRPPLAHKGTYGHAAIVAGSVGKTGAAAMAARAALRVGTGLVTVATPASAHLALESKLLEAMSVPLAETDSSTIAFSAADTVLTLANERSAVAIGPGLTTHPDTVRFVREVLPRFEKPIILDADALNALQDHTDLLHGCKYTPVLTPHPGEMARLNKSESARLVNADRLGTAIAFAQHHRVVLVLKGARSIVANADGTATFCPTGNPGMATAGTGDVLTGMIVGLLAQNLGPWDAARAATYLHGLAGDLAAGQRGEIGMTAGDLIDHIPQAIRQTVL